MAVPATVSPLVIEVNEGNFQNDVIERSKKVPVVVDFWAVWCGPCRTLGPILEGLAQEYGGRFIVAKLNVDENQSLAAQYNIQSIPAVKGFRDGKVAAEFIGAVPRPAVRQFIEKLLPNQLDSTLAAGRALLDEGKPAEAERKYRAVLAQQDDHPAALLGLARAQAAQGLEEEALASLELIPPGTPAANDAAQVRMALDLQRAAQGADESALRAHLAVVPQDLEARFALGSLLTGQKRYQEALEEFLEIVRRDRAVWRNRARQAMLHIFDILGEDALARTYRSRLGSVLFA